MNKTSEKYSHYYKDVSNLKVVDVYRVLSLFEVADPCIQHAVKKLLCTGKRGQKDFMKDVIEARDTLNRFLEMEDEMIVQTVKEKKKLDINGKEIFFLDTSDVVFVKPTPPSIVPHIEHIATKISVQLPINYDHEEFTQDSISLGTAMDALTRKVNFLQNR